MSPPARAPPGAMRIRYLIFGSNSLAFRYRHSSWGC
jgi:hypothetical protein